MCYTARIQNSTPITSLVVVIVTSLWLWKPEVCLDKHQLNFPACPRETGWLVASASCDYMERSAGRTEEKTTRRTGSVTGRVKAGQPLLPVMTTGVILEQECWCLEDWDEYEDEANGESESERRKMLWKTDTNSSTPQGEEWKNEGQGLTLFFFLKKSAVYHLQCFVLLACYYSFMNSSESGLFEYTTGISSQWDAVSSQGITHTLFCTLPKELTNPVHSDRHPWPSPLAPARISVSTCPMYFLINYSPIYKYI